MKDIKIWLGSTYGICTNQNLSGKIKPIKFDVIKTDISAIIVFLFIIECNN